MSAAARARIAAAQKARWAKQKGESETAAPSAAPKRKRKMSAAGRARIIAATKARWARVRAGKEAAAAPARAKRKLSPAAKAKLVANLKKARAAKAAKAA